MNPDSVGETGTVRVYTRDIEFDYVSWMFNAIWVKIQQGATGTPGYISREDGKAAVTDYLLLTQQVNQAEDALNRIYADASIKDKVSATGAPACSNRRSHKQTDGPGTYRGIRAPGTSH